ncbi:hypothetical protein A3Q56_05363 [Intoshia linei]|uniref:Uncharacterized protein n=1 Tax=Intoshia linei TaxID=1819745 RepID=A0A177AZW6_9BILA|nr:hypothetical protein A3Q56_05363 [Intoshia linei]
MKKGWHTDSNHYKFPEAEYKAILHIFKLYGEQSEEIIKILQLQKVEQERVKREIEENKYRMEQTKIEQDRLKREMEGKKKLELKKYKMNKISEIKLENRLKPKPVGKMKKTSDSIIARMRVLNAFKK